MKWLLERSRWGLLSWDLGKLAQPCAGPAHLAMCLWLFFSASGLPSGCGRLSSPAVFSLQWWSVPGMLLWMAFIVQWPCHPLHAQVSGMGTKLCPGWDSVHHWLLGHVYQWHLPGKPHLLSGPLAPAGAATTVSKDNLSLLYFLFMQMKYCLWEF